jgi:FixJ family two-component response regulator
MSVPEPITYVVDDDASVLRSIERLLASVKLPCATFTSADELIRRVDADRIGCIVADMRMPGINGLELQRRLNENGVDLPIVFVTGYSDVPAVIRAMKAGASEVLTKPIGGQELIEAIRAAIAEHADRRKQREADGQLRARYETLTPRERQVMALVVAGKLNKQTAADLGTTEKTIKAHRGQVMKKMGAISLPDLVRMSQRVGNPLSDQAILPAKSGNHDMSRIHDQ